jgi:hypothetical protein
MVSYDGGMLVYEFDNPFSHKYQTDNPSVGVAQDQKQHYKRMTKSFTVSAYGFVLGTDELGFTTAQPQRPQALIGGDIELPFQDNLNLYAYYDRIKNRSNDDLSTSRLTTGLFSRHRFDNLRYELEGAVQMGDVPVSIAGVNQKGSASTILLAGYVGYVSDNAEIGIGFDYFTGDDPNTADDERFEHLNLNIHRHYGAMDFFPFTALPTSGQRPPLAINSLGLIAPHIRAVYSPDKNWKLTATGFLFQLEQPFETRGEEFFDAGYEIDLKARYTISPSMNAEFGISGFLPGNAIKESNSASGLGDEFSYWSYSSLVVSF